MYKLTVLLVIYIYIFSACKKNSSGNSGGGTPDPTPTAKYKNMYIEGRYLKDSSGRHFLIRGNNFPVFWFPSQYKPSLGAASSLGCNTARLVWQVQQQAWTPSLAVLDEALAECIAQKLVPVVELHDYTGGTSAADIANAAAWYTRADVKAILDKYAHVLILNIANEWGDGSVTDLAWRNAYIPAIFTLRNAGYKMPIMIDAPGYGQRETAIVQYGRELLNSDPLKNIIFSAHAYSNWNNSSTYNSRINAILGQDLCFVFGEFGWNVPDAQQPAAFECRVNAPLLMQLCQAGGVGYMAWSWKGNDAANACFEICNSWSDTAQLTTWGRQWAYDMYGVKNTGVKASTL